MSTRVFVSSTSGALTEYRSTVIDVCHRLGLIPVAMETFDPNRLPPLEVCRRAVDSCDIFVLLLAHRYGVRPPDQELSYTELEYQWAVQQPNVTILPFVVDPGHAWSLSDADRANPDRVLDAQRLDRFIDEVCSTHTVKHFRDQATFREDVMIALGNAERATMDGGSSGNARHADATVAAPNFYAAPPYVGSAPFTGRLEDLRTLDLWSASTDPVIVVEAIGGTGKSALAWEWTRSCTESTIPGLAGRFWWSFYEGSASMTRFLQELLAYVSGSTLAEVKGLGLSFDEMTAQVLTELRRNPYLVVLDGFERLLSAYHRFDPSTLLDDDVEENKRMLIENEAEDVVRRLAAVQPSKILISTRLMPTALETRFGHRLAGVRHLQLGGLTNADTYALLERLNIRGSARAFEEFFEPLGNHPLLVGIVAGLVANYRAEPGSFDRWIADPTAGGALAIPKLDLRQRRHHILDAALSGLSPGSRRVLGYISVLAGAVNWETLEAINPFVPDPPEPVRPDLSALGPQPFPPNPFEYRPPTY